MDWRLVRLTWRIGQSFGFGSGNVVLFEGVSPLARDEFINLGYNVEYLTIALQGNELIDKIKDAHIVGVRSRTQLTSEVLRSCNNLFIIGCFCIGTNQVDLTTNGI